MLVEILSPSDVVLAAIVSNLLCFSRYTRAVEPIGHPRTARAWVHPDNYGGRLLVVRRLDWPRVVA